MKLSERMQSQRKICNERHVELCGCGVACEHFANEVAALESSLAAKDAEIARLREKCNQLADHWSCTQGWVTPHHIQCAIQLRAALAETSAAPALRDCADSQWESTVRRAIGYVRGHGKDHLDKCGCKRCEEEKVGAYKPKEPRDRKNGAAREGQTTRSLSRMRPIEITGSPRSEQLTRRRHKMGMFRKKPVVIEAVPYDGTPADGARICDWIRTYEPTNWPDIVRNGMYGLQFRTLETKDGEWLTASAGDWIIRGIKGEFYPCKPDIFSATYESVSRERLEREK